MTLPKILIPHLIVALMLLGLGVFALFFLPPAPAKESFNAQVTSLLNDSERAGRASEMARQAALKVLKNEPTADLWMTDHDKTVLKCYKEGGYPVSLEEVGASLSSSLACLSKGGGTIWVRRNPNPRQQPW